VIHISDIPLPEGVKPTIDRDFVIANITAPSGLVSSDNEAGRWRGRGRGRRGGPRTETGLRRKERQDNTGPPPNRPWRPFPFRADPVYPVAAILPHPPEPEDLAARHRRVIGHRHGRHGIDDALDRARRVVAGMQFQHAEAQRAFPRPIEQLRLRALDIHQDDMRPMRAQEIVKPDHRNLDAAPAFGGEARGGKVILHMKGDGLPFLRAGHDRTVQDRHILRAVARKVVSITGMSAGFASTARTFSGAVRRAQIAVT
jgi:hypothetical protein